MKQLIIIGEGQTEQAFCKDVLSSHFFKRGINLHTPTIKKTKGGIVPWNELKKDIENYLTSPSAIVTTLIDFYGIRDFHGFPQWQESKSIVRKADRMEFLEVAMKTSLVDKFRYRFIPYIQLHEFEALLFADGRIFAQNFQGDEILDSSYLEETLRLAPEDINDDKLTAPSNRLKRIIKGYNKVFYGSYLAQEIGLKKIRMECPRFNQWIEKLESI